MKEHEPIEGYFSLYHGAIQPYSKFRETPVQAAVDILLAEGRLISQTVMVESGIDELIFFPDHERRQNGETIK